MADYSNVTDDDILEAMNFCLGAGPASPKEVREYFERGLDWEVGMMDLAKAIADKRALQSCLDRRDDK